MADSVVDASFLAKSNGCMSGARPGNVLKVRLSAIERLAKGIDRLRCNPRLLTEYEPHTRECRNDLIEQFVALLDDRRTVMLKSSSLQRSDNVKANKCRWPSHDKHLLAAAVGGVHVTIHVTENALGTCAKAVKREFGFTVNYIPS